MNRRSFFAVLAGLPFVGKLVPKAYCPLPQPGDIAEMRDQLVRRVFECPLCYCLFQLDVRNPVGRVRVCPSCELAARRPNELLDDLESKPAPPGPYRYERTTPLPKVQWRRINEGASPRED